VARTHSSASKAQTIVIRPEQGLAEDIQNKTAREVLEVLQSSGVREAVAVRTLRSGDLRVLVQSPSVKDQVLWEASQRPALLSGKVQRQDYSIGVLGVSTAIKVEHGKRREQ